MTTNSAWESLTERERDAVVAEALGLPFVLSSAVFGRLRWTTYHDQATAQEAADKLNVLYRDRARALWEPKAHDKLTSSWPGMGLVVERVVHMGFELTLLSAEDRTVAIWGRGDTADSATVQGKPDKAAPSAAALAAVRAMEGGG